MEIAALRLRVQVKENGTAGAVNAGGEKKKEKSGSAGSQSAFASPCLPLQLGPAETHKPGLPPDIPSDSEARGG